MKDYLKLAWRNIWRNKRRTLITIASIFFAMFFALIMRAIQLGSYGHWADSIVESFTGYIQVHKAGYWDDRTIDNSLTADPSVKEQIMAMENVSAVIPRLESFALASSGEKTKGVLVVGIDPEMEKGLTHPDQKISEGRYLDDQTAGALVSRRLAEFLNIGIDDTLTLISQGYHAATAAGLFPVIGIIDMPNPDLVYKTRKKKH